MKLRNLFEKENPTYPESNGFYERVPIRVKSFSIVKNKEDEVVFQTTSRDFCNENITLELHITQNDEGNWKVNINQGCTQWCLTPTDDLRERISRRRAFWHAGQYMAGRELNHKQTYSLSYTVNNADADRFKDDAFFKNGNAITTDPFGEFLDS
jgi:hypothetical protein